MATVVELMASVAVTAERHGSQRRLSVEHFERDPIPYALETDWPVEDPVEIRTGLKQKGKFPLSPYLAFLDTEIGRVNSRLGADGNMPLSH
jgi:hypothetical protein